MSQYIIQLTKDDQFKAILANNLAYGISQTHLYPNSKFFFNNLIENLKQEFPTFADRLSSLELIKISKDAFYCLCRNEKIFYIIVRGPNIKQYKKINYLINKGLTKNTDIRNKIYKNYRELILEYIDYQFHMVGYSTAANLVEWIGMQEESIQITSFCPTIFEYNVDEKKEYNYITYYKILGDILSSQKKNGKQIEFPITPIKFDNFNNKVVYYHDIDHFTKGINDFEIINLEQESNYQEDEFIIETNECKRLIKEKLDQLSLYNHKDSDDLYSIMDKIYKDPLNNNSPKSVLPKKPRLRPITIKPNGYIPPLHPTVSSHFRPQCTSLFTNKLSTGISTYNISNINDIKPYNSNQYNSLCTGIVPRFINRNNSTINNSTIHNSTINNIMNDKDCSIDNIINTPPAPYNNHDLDYIFNNDDIYL